MFVLRYYIIVINHLTWNTAGNEFDFRVTTNCILSGVMQETQFDTVSSD